MQIEVTVNFTPEHAELLGISVGVIQFLYDDAGRDHGVTINPDGSLYIVCGRTKKFYYPAGSWVSIETAEG